MVYYFIIHKYIILSLPQLDVHLTILSRVHYQQGCGQMLDLSRRTATFFSNETGLKPDLVVVSPLRRAIQSALISFPTHTAQTSLSNTPWICHPMCMEQANGNKSEFVSSSKELEKIFPGVDLSLFDQSLEGGNVHELNGREKVPLFESKIDLMDRTDEFLRWIKERDERVIVGEYSLNQNWHIVLYVNVLTRSRTSFSTHIQYQVMQHGCSLSAPFLYNMNLKARGSKCSRKER